MFLGLSRLIFTSCTAVRQGEVGVKRTLGKIEPQPLPEGLKVFNPFTEVVIKVPAHTVNLEVRVILPSKEGLRIQSDVSILYRVEGPRLPMLIRSKAIEAFKKLSTSPNSRIIVTNGEMPLMMSPNNLD